MFDYLRRLGLTVLIAAVVVLSITHVKRRPYVTEKASSEAVSGQATQVWRITAYCPCEKCCGKWADGITASGKPAEGKLIAAPPEIPFGTWIDIPGYGMAEVLDRGGSIKGRRLDLLFPTHQEALNWGVNILKLKYNYLDNLQ